MAIVPRKGGRNQPAPDRAESHIGSESVNIFQVLCDTLALVEKMAGQIASHVHGPSPVPASAAAFASDGREAATLRAALKP